jgi:hypothetical protein
MITNLNATIVHSRVFDAVFWKSSVSGLIVSVLQDENNRLNTRHTAFARAWSSKGILHICQRNLILGSCFSEWLIGDTCESLRLINYRELSV